MAAAEDERVVHFGDHVQLLSISKYAARGSAKLAGKDEMDVRTPQPIGSYLKHGRHGVLACVPPVGDQNMDKFQPSVFTIEHVSGRHIAGADTIRQLPLTYDEPFYLVGQDGSVWNNSTGGITGYIGPRPRGWSGEMSIKFYSEGRKAGDPVHYEDTNLAIDVEDSNRWLKTYNKRLTNFKKGNSSLIGGYLCSDGSGHDLRFTIVAADGHPSRVSAPVITAADLSVRAICVQKAFAGSVDEELGAYEWGSVVSLGSVGCDDCVKFTLESKVLDLRAQMAIKCPPAMVMVDSEDTDGVVPDPNADVVSIIDLEGHGIGGLDLEATWQCERGMSDPATPAEPATDEPESGEKAGKRRVLFALVALLLAGIGALAAVFVFGVPPGIAVGSAVSAALVPIAVMFMQQSAPVPEDPAPSRRLTFADQSSMSFVVPTRPRLLTLKLLPHTAVTGAAGSEEAAAESAATEAAPAEEEFPPMTERWVRAEKGNRASALARYKVTMTWRRDEKINTLLEEPQPFFDIIKKYYPHYVHRTDKLGHPFYYERPADINIKALKAAGVTDDALLRHYLFITEYLWNVVAKGDDDACCFSVLDMAGLTLPMTRGEAMGYVKRCAKLLGDHYPERSFKMYIINAPWWFNTLYKVVALVLDPVTKAKISVYPAGKKGGEKMKEYVDVANIPSDLGGESEKLGQSPEEVSMAEHVHRINEAAGVQSVMD